MSVFDRLPDELVVKIYLCLKTDSASIKSLIATCRRFCFVVRDYLIHEPTWVESRPLRLRSDSFMYDCVSYRMLVERLNQVKYVPFNTITFYSKCLQLSDCPIHRTQDNLSLAFAIESNQIEFVWFKYIVELRLIECQTNSIWFNSILNDSPNLAYLVISNTSVDIKPNTPCLTAKRLKELRIIDDRFSCDAEIQDLLSHLSPALLDLSGTMIACDGRVKRRFYGNEAVQNQYSDAVLTLYGILSLIEKHKDTLEYLILDRTEIGDDNLIELATKWSLSNLRISARHCPQMTRKSAAFIESSRLDHRISVYE